MYNYYYYYYSAIKTGRYTHEKKTKDIQEVKRLQYRQKLQSGEKSEFLNELNDDAIEHLLHQITEVILPIYYIVVSVNIMLAILSIVH